MKISQPTSPQPSPYKGEGAIKIQKRPGETPLEALNRLRTERPELKDEKLSYAGRLDPLAEGEMIVLVGDANKEQAKYLGLDKVYIVDILFGVTTDTSDVLGMITNSTNTHLDTADIEKGLSTFVGSFSQPYPMYSSMPHEGKPLFAHARSGRNIELNERPHKDVTIYDIHVLEHYTLTPKELQKSIHEKVNSVKGDFRQAEIINKWDEFFAATDRKEFQVVKVKVHCSSGTYMRSLAESLGKKLGSEALALHIKRESVSLLADQE